MSLLLRHTLRLSLTGTISRPTVLTASSPPPTTTLTRAYASKKTKSKHPQKGGGGNRNSSADADADAADADPEFPPSSSSSSSSSYARGSKRASVPTASLTPGSQQALVDPAARDEYARADAKMAACVEWFRREVTRLEARASGRVTPRLLDPVRVSGVAPPSASASDSRKGEKKVRLEEVASVGVRDGSSLIVTVFDPQVRLSRAPLLHRSSSPSPPRIPCFPYRVFL
jgi:hypothetical protein